MDAPSGYCTLCGKPSVDRHHVTGRDPDGVYLHREFVADLCHQHHELVHNVLRSQGVDTPDSPVWNVVTCVAHVLRRVAVFIGQLAPRADNPMWSQLARVLEECASMLDTVGPTFGVS